MLLVGVDFSVTWHSKLLEEGNMKLSAHTGIQLKSHHQKEQALAGQLKQLEPTPLE